MRGMLRDLNPAGKLILLMGVLIGAFLVAMLLTVVLTLVYYKGDVSVLSNMGNIQDIWFLKHMQMIQSLALFSGTAFVAAFLFSTEPKKFLGLDKNNRWIAYFLIVLIAMFIVPFVSWTGQVNMQMPFPESLKWLEVIFRNMEESMAVVVKRFFDDDSFNSFAYNMIMIAVVPAIGEELLFRGVLQNLLHKLFKKHHLAIITTAFIFSAFHMQFLTFLPRFILGILFGYFYFWSKNLWLPILAHFVNNALAVFTYTLNIQELQTLESGEKPISILFAVASLGFVLIIISALRKVIYVDNHTINKEPEEIVQ